MQLQKVTFVLIREWEGLKFGEDERGAFMSKVWESLV
jgi:hypothetical protein